MILVDSSVWIDYFHDRDTRETTALDRWLGVHPIAIGDLIIVEVLQGMRTERLFRLADELFASMDCISIGGRPLAVAAARNYRHLRSLGVTIRRTIDTLIATHCIVDGISLLYSDRDFDPFVEHLGLRPARGDTGVN
jgi:predicted nucleic acid-binding protein